jgi:hypothetical protein
MGVNLHDGRAARRARSLRNATAGFVGATLALFVLHLLLA